MRDFKFCVFKNCACPQSSFLACQSSDEVLQWLSIFRLQQGVQPAEEGQVCEKSVEVGVQTERKCLTVMTPINVSQSPEQQQKHLLDQKDEACWKRSTWEKENLKIIRLKAETGVECRIIQHKHIMDFTCFCGKYIFISQ